MCVLVISYKPYTDVIAMGHSVDIIPGDTQVMFCKTGEEAINHVARLEGWNEPGADGYEHWFIYPDNECPYEFKDATTGEITYKNHCIPMSQASIDVENDSGGIPEHFRAPIEVCTKEYRQQANDCRKCQQEDDRRRRDEERQKDKERQYELLKKELGR